MRRKVTVVGSGNVGASVALRLADQELADVVMTDIIEGIPQGKEIKFNISYKKQDVRPSVDIKSASMASSSGTASSNRSYMIFLAGGVLLLTLLGYYRYRVSRKKG